VAPPLRVAPAAPGLPTVAAIGLQRVRESHAEVGISVQSGRVVRNCAVLPSDCQLEDLSQHLAGLRVELKPWWRDERCKSLGKRDVLPTAQSMATGFDRKRTVR